METLAAYPSMDTFVDTECPGGGSWTCTACPVQAEGFMPDGRAWYFRARHGAWSFSVSKGPTDDIDDAIRPDGIVLLEGDDPHEGFMPANEAAAIIRRCLSRRGGAFLGETDDGMACLPAGAELCVDPATGAL